MNVCQGVKFTIRLSIEFNKSGCGEFLASFTKRGGSYFDNRFIAFVLYLKKAIQFALNCAFVEVEEKTNEIEKGELSIASKGFFANAVFVDEVPRMISISNARINGCKFVF